MIGHLRYCRWNGTACTKEKAVALRGRHVVTGSRLLIKRSILFRSLQPNTTDVQGFHDHVMIYLTPRGMSRAKKLEDSEQKPGAS